MSNQMSREQAALNMLHLLNMDEGRAWHNKRFTPCEKQSFEMAIAALRQPILDWVRTADRLPTEAELGPCGHVRVCDKDGHTGIALYAEFRLHPREYPYWHPLLKAPQDAEKEEKDDNSHRAIQRGEA